MKTLWFALSLYLLTTSIIFGASADASSREVRSTHFDKFQQRWSTGVLEDEIRGRIFLAIKSPTVGKYSLISFSDVETKLEEQGSLAVIGKFKVIDTTDANRENPYVIFMNMKISGDEMRPSVALVSIEDRTGSYLLEIRNKIVIFKATATNSTNAREKVKAAIELFVAASDIGALDDAKIGLLSLRPSLNLMNRREKNIVLSACSSLVKYPALTKNRTFYSDVNQTIKDCQ